MLVLCHSIAITSPVSVACAPGRYHVQLFQGIRPTRFPHFWFCRVTFAYGHSAVGMRGIGSDEGLYPSICHCAYVDSLFLLWCSVGQPNACYAVFMQGHVAWCSFLVPQSLLGSVTVWLYHPDSCLGWLSSHGFAVRVLVFWWRTVPWLPSGRACPWSAVGFIPSFHFECSTLYIIFVDLYLCWYHYCRVTFVELCLCFDWVLDVVALPLHTLTFGSSSDGRLTRARTLSDFHPRRHSLCLSRFYGLFLPSLHALASIQLSLGLCNWLIAYICFFLFFCHPLFSTHDWVCFSVIHLLLEGLLVHINIVFWSSVVSHMCIMQKTRLGHRVFTHLVHPFFSFSPHIPWYCCSSQLIFPSGLLYGEVHGGGLL